MACSWLSLPLSLSLPGRLPVVAGVICLHVALLNYLFVCQKCHEDKLLLLLMLLLLFAVACKQIQSLRRQLRLLLQQITIIAVNSSLSHGQERTRRMWNVKHKTNIKIKKPKENKTKIKTTFRASECRIIE